MRIIIVLLALLVVLDVHMVFGQTVAADRFRLNTGPCVIRSGSGSPEGVVTGAVCDTYINTANGQIYTKWTGTGNTGWGVGFQVNAVTGTMQTSTYASQTTGYQLTSGGSLDVRYLFTDELRAKLFSVEEQAVYRSSLMVTPSHSEVSQTFTCPAAAGTATLWVKDAATLGDARVFNTGDWVSIRNFSRTDADADGNQELDISDCVGQVTSYADGSGANAGQQSWTFTRGSGGSAGTMTATTTVAVGNAVLDFGDSGNGAVELSACDGAECIYAPYIQTKKWTTAPVAANFVPTSRMGNLQGITGIAEESGFIGGVVTGDVNTAYYVRASSFGVFLHNMNLNTYHGGTNTISLNASVPLFSIGNPAPTTYGSGTGIWMGNDGGTYKFRVGNPAGNRLTWDGTTLSVIGDGSGMTSINGANIQTGTVAANKLTVGTGINQVRNSECKASTDDWAYYTDTGLSVTFSTFLSSAWALGGTSGTCYFTLAGTPAGGTVTEAYTTDIANGFQVLAGNKYEASAYIGVHRSGNTYVQIHWYEVDLDPISVSDGSACTASNSGGKALAPDGSASGYCRSAVIATAPTNATFARIAIWTNHTAENQPYIFFTRAYFGEALINQTEFTPWGGGGITEITGGLIKTGTITASHIAADTITADQIATFNLSAISANIGTVTAGTITGVSITTTTGTIGGFTLGTTTLTGDNLVIANTGNITVGTGNNVARMSDDGTIRFWAGHATAGSAPFQVSQAGAVTMSDATIEGTFSTLGGSFSITELSGIEIIEDIGNAQGISWDSGSFVQGYLGELQLNGQDGMDVNVNNGIIDFADAPRITPLAGTGTRHVCADADGDLVICP